MVFRKQTVPEPRLNIGSRIARTRELVGVNCPAIIHNMQYFFVDLKVYEDGIVDCWSMVDLKLFEEKVASGWIRTSVPDGKVISIFGLGAWTVEAGQWDLPPQKMSRHVKELVRGLNPTMQNLHDCHGTATRTVGKVRVSTLAQGSPRPVRLDRPTSPLARHVSGAGLSAFLRCSSGDVFLADLRVFVDGLVELGRLPEVEALAVEALPELVRSGRLMTSPPPGTRVQIHGLGSFTLGESMYATAVDQLLLEVADLVKRLRGEPTSIDVCRAAHEAYCQKPTHAGVEQLRQAYEAIPEHNRMYVGDMDTKDVPIRMIIYGDQEIEGWSHRAVARREGIDSLPSIEVPKPEPDDSE